MKITTIGIDLAKAVFQVYGVEERGKVLLRKQLKRKDVAGFFANLQPCLIGMEGCGSAHYWGRTLAGLGHTVRLMAPQFMKAYVKTNKNDRNNAEAICEAVGRPNMRFVPIKNAEVQTVLALHRSRQGFVKARTAVLRKNSLLGFSSARRTAAWDRRIWDDARTLHLARAISGVLSDALKLGVVFLRSSSSIRTENLVLRRKLAQYIERVDQAPTHG